jgi:hypothetical protein
MDCKRKQNLKVHFFIKLFWKHVKVCKKNTLLISPSGFICETKESFHSFHTFILHTIKLISLKFNLVSKKIKTYI